MIQTGLIQNAHEDLVTDAAYDFYGLRLATAGLDQKVKVWALNEKDGSWVVQDAWKAHDAAVTRLSWAHPEFGSIVASSSFDRTVKIWEQTFPDPTVSATAGSAPQTSEGASRWVERTALADARGTVRGVAFAPHHFGLKLATIASDNVLRVYECLEQPALHSWQLGTEIDIPTLTVSTASNTTASNSAGIQPAALNFGPDGGPPPSLVTHALQHAPSSDALSTTTRPTPGAGAREADGGWALAWCHDRYWGEIVAATAGIDGVVKVVQLSPSRRPRVLIVLDPHGDSSSRPRDATTWSITSVAWAPSCGRSYHLIATGGRDGHVRIWRLEPPPLPDSLLAQEGDEDIWSARVIADFDEHKGAVGRVEWNITGTVLSSSGNDGRVRVWKATRGNVWRAAGHISVEQAEPQEQDISMDDGR